MLLNTWLTAAKRQFFGSSASDRDARRSRRAVAKPTSVEQLEAKTLLTALVINNSNVNDFVDADGLLSITNADLDTHDTVVIEDISLNATASAIQISLSDVPLSRLAIESVDVNAFSGAAIDIDLTNVTGTRTISIEDINITGNVTSSTGAGVDVEFDGTNVHALTIEDSVLPGVIVSAVNGARITNGIVTENTIDAPQNVEGVLLNVNSGGNADNFQIVNNYQIAALDDAVRVNLDDVSLDGLVIADNVIGNEPAADFLFRAEGDTFNEPFELMNNATAGEEITSFTLDLRPIGLVFDPTDLPFTVSAGTSAGVVVNGQPTPSDNNQVLTVNFDAFAPGETLLFTIDVDNLASAGTGAVDFTAFGSDLIGAAVDVQFTGNKSVDGFMVGDPDVLSASRFARGAGAGSNFHGVNLDLTGSPLTNTRVSGNTVTGVAGHGIFFDARNHSNITGVVQGNLIESGSQDGLRFGLSDSDFAGAVLDNTISANGGNGIGFFPSVSRTGAVEAALDSNPLIITSTNHQLQTGDQIILQGLVNDDPDINHPGNGVHTVTRVDNNRFQLQGVDGTANGVRYAGGGNWYVPDFRDASGNPSTDPLDDPRGLVSIDVQAAEPTGRIQDIQSGGAGAGAIITSFDHGLASGDRVRIRRADGTGISGTQTFKITVLTVDTFQLDSQPLNGVYDTSGGLASWTTNVIDAVTETGEIIVTSEAHGLQTGDQIRVVGAVIATPGRSSAANGQWTVTRLSEDTFALQGSSANGVHVSGTGHWVPYAAPTFTGDIVPQLVSGNLVTSNRRAGFHVDLQTGTRFDGDIVTNTFTGNIQKGIYIESHSFGLGTELPLDPTDPLALPSVQDISFEVNIGTSETDGNIVNQNTEAGIVIEALDFATGSFGIRGNEINANLNDNPDNSPFYEGDGIVVRLDSDLLSAEAIGFLTESVIADNQIGVDSRGNQGNGFNFAMSDRTRIQDLEIIDNSFVNNGLDGFHFVRTEDADLNSVVFDGSRATNNEGDGFDIFAENTVKDRIDFRILDSVIDNNGHYGVRADIQADARIELDIQQSSIRENGAGGNGFAPEDGEGTLGESGGVGIHAFQQIDVILDITETNIERNIGDGLSIDADNFFDTLVIDVSIVDSKLNSNSRTGLRSVGSAYGEFELLRSDFNGNGTDGARFISNEDPDDFFDRRVGGLDLDIIGLGNDFQGNADNGIVIGQGYSAVFGNGDPTEDFANRFGGRAAEGFEQFTGTPAQPSWGEVIAGDIAGNGEDGFKVVQDAGPYLRDLGRRRVIETDTNVFTHNAEAGVDIGHYIPLEGGNASHGDEVVSDTDITIENGDISNNAGDGVEYLADNFQRVPPVIGGGQDGIPEPNVTSLTVSNSDIKNNGERGVDILNRHSEDSRVTVRNNEVIGNGFSGIYVVNTSSRDQLQNGPEDELAAELWIGGGIPSRTPNIELRIQDNLIESNGTAGRQSTVPINSSNDGADGAVGANDDFYHLTDRIEGTLGGVTIRVGTTDTSGRIAAAAPEYELSLSGVDAEIWKNNFDGNFGADVYLDNFVSLVPPQSGGVFTITPPPDHQWNRGFRDPLSRFDLSFRENTGNSLDVINGFAFYDNDEPLFKRRILNGAPAPNPDGPFVGISTRNDRNATRTLGYFSDVGDDPGNTAQWGFQGADLLDGIDASLFNPFRVGPYWSYDGWGTPTWRIESDFDFDNFESTDVVSGLSDFFDEINLGFGLAEEHYQWDTGVNVPGFTGATPFSLTRGDIFDVQAGEDPIFPDELEENDSFFGATDLGTVAGAGFNVNALTSDSRLTIETKGDRDYYRFVAAGTGNLTVNLGATDANGSDLSFLVYEIDPLRNTNEIPLIRAADGSPVRSIAAAGGTGIQTVPVVAGRSYIVEVLGVETSNVVPAVIVSPLNSPAEGKSFVYGTVRSYDLTIDAPAAAPITAQAPENSVATVVPVESVNAPGVTAAVSIAGAQPSVASITGPAADLVSVSTNTITVTFTEDVTGVDLSDFQLVQNASVVDLSTATFTGLALDTYQISNLSSLTLNPGVYEFSIQLQDSNIVDTDAEPIVVSPNNADSITWTVDNSVNSAVDAIDNIPGDGIFADVNGNRTLRAAIMEANVNDGPDIINVSPGIYALSLAGRFEDQSLTGDLDVTGELTIRGTGATAADTVIDAADLDRVFHVLAGAELTLENLTIRGGEAFDGAGVFVEDILVIQNPDDTVTTRLQGALNLTGVSVVDNEAYNQGEAFIILVPSISCGRPLQTTSRAHAVAASSTTVLWIC